MANNYGYCEIGPGVSIGICAGGGTATTFTMATGNNCAAFRFVAPSKTDGTALDCTGGWLNWSTVSSPGTITCRIETDNAGKPSGTLYDANATVTFTPTAGWQQFTFAVAPTTTLTAGSIYWLVVITATGGTTQTLRAYWLPSQGVGPAAVFTATDGSTRSSLAIVAQSMGIATLTFSDGTEQTRRHAAFAAATTFDVYGTRASGCKFTIPTNESWTLRGVRFWQPVIAGSPDSFRASILSGSGTYAATLISGTSVSLPVSSITSARNVDVPFNTPVVLTAGTYRAVLDAPGHATTSTNKYTLYQATIRTGSLVPANWVNTNTTDITASPVVWTDDATTLPCVTLLLEDMPVVSSGGTTYVFLSGD